MFLSIFRNFQKHLFYITPPVAASDQKQDSTIWSENFKKLEILKKKWKPFEKYENDLVIFGKMFVAEQDMENERM